MPAVSAHERRTQEDSLRFGLSSSWIHLISGKSSVEGCAEVMASDLGASPDPERAPSQSHGRQKPLKPVMIFSGVFISHTCARLALARLEFGSTVLGKPAVLAASEVWVSPPESRETLICPLRVDSQLPPTHQ